MFDFIVDVEEQEFGIFVNDKGEVVLHSNYEYVPLENDELELEYVL